MFRVTRNRGDGFDEKVMYSLFCRSCFGRWLELTLSIQGFRYGGDTGSLSKASTDTRTKTIKINKNLTVEIATLSYTYELSNALQAESYNLILKEGRLGTVSPEEFVLKIIEREAKSVLFRSRVACEIGLAYLVKNQKFIVIECSKGNDEEKIQAIIEEVITNGTVYQGTIGVTEHYLDMYYKIRR